MFTPSIQAICYAPNRMQKLIHDNEDFALCDSPSLATKPVHCLWSPNRVALDSLGFDLVGGSQHIGLISHPGLPQSHVCLFFTSDVTHGAISVIICSSASKPLRLFGG